MTLFNLYHYLGLGNHSIYCASGRRVGRRHDGFAQFE